MAIVSPKEYDFPPRKPLKGDKISKEKKSWEKKYESNRRKSYTKRLALSILWLIGVSTYSDYQKSKTFYDSWIQLQWDKVISPGIQEYGWLAINDIITHNSDIFTEDINLEHLLYNINQWEMAIQSSWWLHTADEALYYIWWVERWFDTIWKSISIIFSGDGSYGSFQTQRDSYNDLLDWLDNYYSQSHPERLEQQYHNLATIKLQDFDGDKKNRKELFQIAWYDSEAEFIKDIKANKVYQWAWHGAMWFAFGISQIYLIYKYIQDSSVDRLQSIDTYWQYIDARKDLEKSDSSYNQLSELKLQKSWLDKQWSKFDELEDEIWNYYNLIARSKKLKSQKSIANMRIRIKNQTNNIIIKAKEVGYVWKGSVSLIRWWVWWKKEEAEKTDSQNNERTNVIEKWPKQLIWIKRKTYERIERFFASKGRINAQVAPYWSSNVLKADTSTAVQHLISMHQIYDQDWVVVTDGNIWEGTKEILSGINETPEHLLGNRDQELSSFLHKTLIYPSLEQWQKDILVNNMMTMSYENKIISLACLKKFILDHPNEPQGILGKIDGLLDKSDDGVGLFTKELLALMSRPSLNNPTNISHAWYEEFVASYLLPHLIATTHTKSNQWRLIPQARNYHSLPQSRVSNNTNTLLRLNLAYKGAFDDLVDSIQKDLIYGQ